MGSIQIGDKIRFKDFKYLKKHNQEFPLWRLFELSNRKATIKAVIADDIFITNLDNKYSVNNDMFNKLSEDEIKYDNAFHLKQ